MVALDVQIVVAHVSVHASVSLLSNLQKFFVSSIWTCSLSTSQGAWHGVTLTLVLFSRESAFGIV